MTEREKRTILGVKHGVGVLLKEIIEGSKHIKHAIGDDAEYASCALCALALMIGEIPEEMIAARVERAVALATAALAARVN